MRKLIIFMSAVLIVNSNKLIAQDKSSLAKVEYEMAEEALAGKKYPEVTTHLNKCVELLGKTNFKIDYLYILNIYDWIENPSVKNSDKEEYYFDLKNRTQKFLKEYNSATNKDKYETVYRIESSIESKTKEIANQFNTQFNYYKKYSNTIDSLCFFKKTNWLEEKHGLDGIWRLGRTYEAILSFYKSGIVKKINSSKNSITNEKQHFKSYVYNGRYFVLENGFIIQNLNKYLPDSEVQYSGNTYFPQTAWFNESGRLYAIKYIRKNTTNSKFGESLANAYIYKEDRSQKYVTGSEMILEYFEDVNESGLFLVYPASKMEAEDSDGFKLKSKVSSTYYPDTRIFDAKFFLKVNNYVPNLFFGCKTSQNNIKGVEITSITSKKTAEIAGLKINDIITRIKYKQIFDWNGYVLSLLKCSIGEEIEIEYYRNKQYYTTKVIIEKYPYYYYQ